MGRASSHPTHFPRGKGRAKTNSNREPSPASSDYLLPTSPTNLTKKGTKDRRRSVSRTGPRDDYHDRGPRTFVRGRQGGFYRRRHYRGEVGVGTGFGWTLRNWMEQSRELVERGRDIYQGCDLRVMGVFSSGK